MTSKKMKEKKMKEFIWSLVWYASSNYHYTNVHEILRTAYPAEYAKGGFTDLLKDFERIEFERITRGNFNSPGVPQEGRPEK